MNPEKELAKRFRELADQADNAKTDGDRVEIGIAIAELESWWERMCFPGFHVLEACRIRTF